MDLVDFAASDVDLAIRYGAGPYPGLEAIRLINETVIPVMSPDLMAANPVNTPTDLARQVLLHDGSPDADESCPRLADVAGGARPCAASTPPAARASTSRASSSRAAVSGRGVALAKRTLAQDDLDAGRLIAPMPISTMVDFALLPRPPQGQGPPPPGQGLRQLDQGRGPVPRAGPGDHRQRRRHLSPLPPGRFCVWSAPLRQGPLVGRLGRGCIAQLVEQLTLNQRVVGSIPTAPTKVLGATRFAGERSRSSCGCRMDRPPGRIRAAARSRSCRRSRLSRRRGG